jgi:hypothetical protein
MIPSSFPMRYSLRTLLIVVTTIGIVLGYQINWIHQRHRFLADQLARHDAAWAGHETDPQKARTLDWWRNQLATDKRAPLLLWLFGEPAVDRLIIVIPEEDVIERRKEDSVGVYRQSEMTASQSDYRRARRLFPEAKVMPMRWSDHIPDGGQRAFYEIQIAN